MYDTILILQVKKKIKFVTTTIAVSNLANGKRVNVS